LPNIERDDAGNVVGSGLTLRETPHVFEVDGRRLYTWCALDALMFPALLGKSARVSSPCAATGAPVRLTVTPDGVENIEPAEAVVSLVLPHGSPDVRGSFCVHVNFFASAAAAQTWLSAHPGATVARVEDAFRLGQELSRRLFAHSCC
jgi:alkylmercury lyase